MGKLNMAKIKSAVLPGLYGDGGTLYLAVAPGGSKSWIQRVVIDGTRREIGLGGWPVVSLAKARKRAFENRVAIADGRDPLAEKREAKRKAKVPTFREAFDEMFKAKRETLRTEKAAKLWRATLDRYAMPILGDMTVDRIGREDVLRVLTPIWTAKPETGRKVRQRVRATLAWAEAHGHVERNIAGDAINGALPAMPATASNLRALPHGEVAAALDTIEASDSGMSARLALRFLILTAARSGEVRGAAWDEIDTDARRWTIPGSRMKAGNEHRVPLSDAALAVLDAMRPFADESGLIFPGARRGSPLSDMTLTKVLRTVGLADRATVHGFRSTFRDWAGECTEADHAVIEISLAHSVGNAVERAYARSDLLSKRGALMARWADYCTGTAGKVVALHRTG